MTPTSSSTLPAVSLNRAVPPALGPERPVAWPKRMSVTLPNGLQVVLAESHVFPKISAQLFIRSGNAAIAHRDPNALIQYRAIRDLKVADVMALAVEFYSAVDQFMPVLTKLVLVSGTMPAMLRQWAAKT